MAVIHESLAKVYVFGIIVLLAGYTIITTTTTTTATTTRRRRRRRRRRNPFHTTLYIFIVFIYLILT